MANLCIMIVYAKTNVSTEKAQELARPWLHEAHVDQVWPKYS